MTNFSWWQGEANKIGLVMCMSCFEMKNVELMHKDEAGDVWDLCTQCQRKEDLCVWLRDHVYIYKDERWPKLHAYTVKGGNNRGDYVVWYDGVCQFFVRADGTQSVTPGCQGIIDPRKLEVVQALRTIYGRG